MDTDVSPGGNTAGESSAPATFAEANWSASDVSPTSDPGTQDSTTLAAVQPDPVGTESPQQQDDRSPLIPRPRFDEAITERNSLREWKQQHAWAENQALRQGAERLLAYQGNPMGLLSEITDSLAQTPEGQQALRSFLGQKFGGLRQRQSQEPAALQPPEADVAIYDQQGNVVGKTYSADALAQRDAFLKQQLLQEVTQQFAPQMQTLKTIEEREQQQAAQAQADAFAGSFFQEVQTLPHYTKEMGQAIALELKSNQLSRDAHPAEVNAATYRAYLKILARDVLPKLDASSKSQLLDSLQQKATASTAVNPSSAAPTSRSSVNSFHSKDLTW